MANLEIRKTAKRLGVFLWQVADAYGVNEGTLSRKLRRELPQEERDKILEIIAELARENRGMS